MAAIGLRAVVAASLLASTVFAQAQVFAGSFSDSTNAALVGSDLSSPLFDTDADIANNVAIYSFVVATLGTVSIQSTGFASGGADPYFTLFAGAGTSATFVDSNYDQAVLGTGGDFSYTGLLAPGTYQIGLGSFENESYAENLGTGTLADGFIGLGVASSLRNGGYRLVVNTAATVPAVPEPASWVLLCAGGLAIRRRVRQRRS